MEHDATEAMDDHEILRLPEQLVLVGSEFLVDSVGVSVRPGSIPTLAGSERTIKNFSKVDKGLHFWLGDMANAIKDYEWESQVLDQSCGFSLATIKHDAWVAGRVPDENRRIAPSFGHAATVAGCAPPRQKEWLEKARAEDWSIAKLKAEMAASEEGGHTKLLYVLIVDCQSESKMIKLAEHLSGEGFTVTTRTSAKREKGGVTAKKKRARKINTKPKKS